MKSMNDYYWPGYLLAGFFCVISLFLMLYYTISGTDTFDFLPDAPGVSKLNCSAFAYYHFNALYSVMYISGIIVIPIGVLSIVLSFIWLPMGARVFIIFVNVLLSLPLISIINGNILYYGGGILKSSCRNNLFLYFSFVYYILYYGCIAIIVGNFFFVIARPQR